MPQLRGERLGIVCLPLAPTQARDHGTFGAAISLSNFKSGRVLWGSSGSSLRVVRRDSSASALRMPSKVHVDATASRHRAAATPRLEDFPCSGEVARFVLEGLAESALVIGTACSDGRCRGLCFSSRHSTARGHQANDFVVVLSERLTVRSSPPDNFCCQLSSSVSD